MKKSELIEGVHYYINENGMFVFTEKYHLERGWCCGDKRKDGKRCKHCPYHKTFNMLYEGINYTYEGCKAENLEVFANGESIAIKDVPTDVIEAILNELGY